MDILKNGILTFITFIIVDYLWLGLIAKNFMSKQLSHIARMKGESISPFMPSGAAVYVAMTIALEFFVFNRGNADLLSLVMQGALLGFLIYSVFDFTNHAILKNYPVPFMIVDITAGTTLFAIVTALSFWVRQI